MQIEGHTFVVFGGSSGLGAACARHLAQLGAKVAVADIRAPDESEGLQFVQADVTDEAAVRGALNTLKEQHEAVHGVVVCAGVIHGQRIIGRDGPFDLAAFQRVIDVNLVGTFNVLRLAAEVMQHNEPNSQGERGVIVMTSSVAAFEGQIGQAAYAASKGGVAALTLPAARELGRLGIRVVAVAPGVFDTPMMQQVPQSYRESLEAATAFPSRFGRAEEYAQLVEHICRNVMLNGSTIRLDGGLRMPPR